MTDEYFHKTTNVNFSGVFYCAREAGKVFKKQGSGSFIITASMSGHIVNVPNTQAVYNAHSTLDLLAGRCFAECLISDQSVEAGVIHLGKSLAFEWKDFARVNIVSPGFVDTAMGAFEEILEVNRHMTVMGRQADPKEFKVKLIEGFAEGSLPGCLLPRESSSTLQATRRASRPDAVRNEGLLGWRYLADMQNWQTSW